MKGKLFVCILLVALALAGCSVLSPKEDSEKDSSFAAVGDLLAIDNIDERFQRQDSSDFLATDGMYYLSWVMEDAVPFTNTQGDVVDAYGARLHLLLQQFTDEEKALENKKFWLATGKENYAVLSEEEISCNGVDYTLITYNVKNVDNPYARGASALGVFDNNAVCIELMCREDFEKAAKEVLIDFLENCSVP